MVSLRGGKGSAGEGAAVRPRTSREVFLRLVTGFAVFFFLVLIVLLGHFYLSAFVFLIINVIFRELLALRRSHHREAPIRLNLLLNTYLFTVCVTLFYARSLAKSVHFGQNAAPRWLVPHYGRVLAGAYLPGLCCWAATLRRPTLRYQTRLFVWTHLALLLGYLSSWSVQLVYEGMVWWLTGVLQVIVNDCAAYFVGKKLGRHRLIAVSPNKTVEGFLGGFAVAFLANAVWNRLLLLPCLQFLLCPQPRLTLRPFAQPRCAPAPLFAPRPLHLPGLSRLVGEPRLSPFALHSYVLALISGTLAPFGGFFFSAVKRTLGVKDFAATLPGHGGFLDRFDCSMVMTIFTYVYLRDVVRAGSPSPAAALYYLARLPAEAREALWARFWPASA